MNFHIILQILISSVAATSVMTLFSYAVSMSAREIYKEPLLLTYILTGLHLKVSPNLKTVLGWILHYLIGLCFVMGYHFLWFNEFLEVSWAASILLGIISGIIGIISWVILFEIVPQKPNIDFKGYYIQLFVAHVIFSVIAFLVYKLFL
ncbi:MAG: hypothetical protein ABIP27_17895 [Flavobacterium circumlabens]|uniref:DUF2938 family protein n=1 Tax=Flavobacterium circumlabens TaxID=2133765 RepID=A0A4Y7UFT2_9FLAO|nr:MULTISPECIES: hypothetical protein [Flavobacterium]QSB25491.1 hypothetical protein HAV12_014030 [Flavobacterium sp. CLA17]TCN60043.1 hypothetical protein EV142_102663 [Flavobacterium circumlabens]TEB45277.1 hypothetical protein D0809_08930 [Flavobacterium circumlabens]